METTTAPIRPVDRNLTSPWPYEIVVLAGERWWRWRRRHPWAILGRDR